MSLKVTFYLYTGTSFFKILNCFFHQKENLCLNVKCYKPLFFFLYTNMPNSLKLYFEYQRHCAIFNSPFERAVSCVFFPPVQALGIWYRIKTVDIKKYNI